MMPIPPHEGNGNCAYVDSRSEAHRVLVEQVTGTLLTIARDAKIQVEFNPARVAAWRLIGYENRLLLDRDFNDDAKGAGEIGAGHRVTALYEWIPAGSPREPDVDPLRYRCSSVPTAAGESGETLTVRVRYGDPAEPFGAPSRLLVRHVIDPGAPLAAADDDYRFAAAVAAYGMLLRDSPHVGQFGYGDVERLARAGLGADPRGRRAEFLQLVEEAQWMSPRPER